MNRYFAFAAFVAAIAFSVVFSACSEKKDSTLNQDQSFENVKNADTFRILHACSAGYPFSCVPHLIALYSRSCLTCETDPPSPIPLLFLTASSPSPADISHAQAVRSSALVLLLSFSVPDLSCADRVDPQVPVLPSL